MARRGARSVALLVVLCAAPLDARDRQDGDSADVDYRRGMDFARLEQWDQARRALEAGRKKAPRDKRFALELAGVAFKQGRLGESKLELRRALRLAPGDAYAADFLATLYFLDGNLRAALKYWNRAGKPRIEVVRTIPKPRVKPALLDRALVFSPASLLRLEDLEATDARLDLLGIFPARRFALAPRQDGSFDLDLHLAEQDGAGASRFARLLPLLRGLPYQTVHPEFFNIRGTASSSISLLRWDGRKQRIASSFSLPLAGDPRRRFTARFDARREEWDISRSARPDAFERTDLRMQRLEAAAEVESIAGRGVRWETGAALTRRRFPAAPQQGSAAPALFADGLSLKHLAGIRATLLSVPERRFTAEAFARWQAAKTFGDRSGRFAKLDGGLQWRYFPRPRGRDWEVSGALGAGTLFGRAPLDELFSLGLERDNDLALRGHAGTLAGRKGSGPLGTGYFLANCDLQRAVYSGALWSIRAGPFVDTGRVYDTAGAFGSARRLWDVGLEVRISLLDRVGIVFSYGRDLRAGRSAFYGTSR